jgi:hypothetical protein
MPVLVVLVIVMPFVMLVTIIMPVMPFIPVVLAVLSVFVVSVTFVLTALEERQIHARCGSIGVCQSTKDEDGGEQESNVSFHLVLKSRLFWGFKKDRPAPRIWMHSCVSSAF